MTARIIIVAALSAALLVAGFAALWVGSGVMVPDPGPTSVLQEDLDAYLARQLWIGMLAQASGPFIGAGLIAGVGALALVVRRRSEQQA